MKVEVDVLRSPSLIVLMGSVPRSRYGLCGRKAAFNLCPPRAQELGESRGRGRPGFPVPKYSSL